MKKIFIRSILGLVVTTTMLSGIFLVTRGMDPHAAELAYVEASEMGIGSVVPASCESGNSHFGDCSPPTVSVSISPNPALNDGNSQHTIISRVTYADGVNHVRESQVGINLQGPNAGTYRGLFGWSNIGFPGWYGVYKSAPIACAGGGVGAIYGGDYGYEYLNLLSCRVTYTQFELTVTYVVTINPSFTAPINDNTLSGYAHTGASDSGWIPSGTFSIQQPNPVLDCQLPWGGTVLNGGSVTAYQFPSDLSCTGETRTCVNGVLSGSFTNQNCTIGSSCPVGTTLEYSHPAKTCSNVPQGGSDQCTTPASPNTPYRLIDAYMPYTAGNIASLSRDFGCSLGFWSGWSYCWGNAVNGVCPNDIIQGSFDWGAYRVSGQHEAALLCFPSEVPVCVSQNQAPTVNAGPDMSITQLAGTAVVSGASASDPEGQPLTLTWVNITTPGSVPIISGDTTLTPTFSNLVTPGTYAFRIAAIDNVGNTSYDFMNVTVTGASMGTFTATDCEIPGGQNTCSSNVTWEIINPLLPVVTAKPIGRPTVQVSSNPTGTNVPHTIPYGPTVFEARDSSLLLGTVTATARCAANTVWDGTKCVDLSGTGSIQGTLTATPNLVLPGGQATLEWNVTNAGLLRCGVVSADTIAGRRSISSAYSSAPGGELDSVPINAKRTYFLWCNTNSNVLATAEVDVARPTLTATPRQIRTGTNTRLNYDTQGQTNCTLLGNLVTGTGSVQTPNITAQTTYTMSCPLGTASVTVEILATGYET